MSKFINVFGNTNADISTVTEGDNFIQFAKCESGAQRGIFSTFICNVGIDEAGALTSVFIAIMILTTEELRNYLRKENGNCQSVD